MRKLAALLSFVALASTAVLAQDGPAAAPVTTSPATKPMDCSPVRRHDHGAERQMPGTVPAACAPAAGASAAKTRARPLHDHGKFHKNQ